MGTFSDWSYTAKCTVWEPTLDEFGQPSSWSRTVFDCSYRAGARMPVSDRGQEFIPSTTVWLSSSTPPKNGSKIAIGSSTSTTPPASAETIRVVRSHDPSLFSQGTPDHEIFTQ